MVFGTLTFVRGAEDAVVAPEPAAPVAGAEAVPVAVVLEDVAPEKAVPEPEVRKTVALLEIPLPITWSSVQTINRTLLKIRDELRTVGEGQGNRPTLVLSFQVPPNQDMLGRGSQFGACYGLAETVSSDEFRGIRTVAFFPQSVQGHAILLALACEELIVSDNCEFGNAGVDEKRITPAIRQAYRDIGRRFPEKAVEKMLDPTVELWQAETDSGTVWTDRAGLGRLREEGKLLKEPDEPFLPAGVPGLWTAQEAREQGLADFLVEAKDGFLGLAKALGIRPEQINFAKVYTEINRTVRIDLIGPITSAKTGEVERQIRKAIEGGGSLLAAAGQNVAEEPPADFICLWIDSPGGSLEASLSLAGFLANDIDPMRVRTVAYVPHQARSDAAIIALACQETVLGNGAILGGSGEAVFSEREIRSAIETISHSLARKSLRRWSLPAAMIDPDLQVYKMTRKSDPSIVEFFCEEELNQQGDRDDWIRGAPVTRLNTPFLTVGREALGYSLADKIATDFGEFKLLYHLTNDPQLMTPGWADQLVRALANPYLSMILLVIGFGAFWAELKTPGIGAGAFVAICCFTLFFWSKYLGGTAGWLEVMLFLTGVLFVLLEIFVIPGFGLFGIGGGLAILGSLVLASQTFIIPRNSYQMEQFGNSLLVLVISLSGMSLIAFAFAHYLNEANKPRKSEDLAVRESEKLADYAHLSGAQGVAGTRLVPAGKGLFGEESVDVVSEGELIEAGTPIVVVDVRGYRVIVRAV